MHYINTSLVDKIPIPELNFVIKTGRQIAGSDCAGPVCIWKEVQLLRAKLFIFVLVTLLLLHCNSSVFAQTEEMESYNTPQSTIVFWTDGPRLKAVNLTFFPNHAGPLGIVSVPLYACLGKDNDNLTLAEYYLKHGRVKLIRQLEQLFGTPIETYISVDQKSLTDASKLIGTIQMAGVDTNFVDVFEGRYVDGPVNLQVEIRQLASALTTPTMLIKLPQVIWVFATQVDTNIGPGQILNFYRLLKSCGPELLQKKAVPGRDYRVGGYKYRQVEPEVWAKTVQEVTTRQ